MSLLCSKAEGNDCSTDVTGLCTPGVTEIIEETITEEVTQDSTGITTITTTVTDTTTTTVFISASFLMISATAAIRSPEPTDVPPNF